MESKEEEKDERKKNVKRTRIERRARSEEKKV